MVLDSHNALYYVEIVPSLERITSASNDSRVYIVTTLKILYVITTCEYKLIFFIFDKWSFEGRAFAAPWKDVVNEVIEVLTQKLGHGAMIQDVMEGKEEKASVVSTHFFKFSSIRVIISQDGTTNHAAHR